MKEDHQHYWKIDMPDGLISKGICKYCGDVREFNNSYQVRHFNGPAPGTKTLNNPTGRRRGRPKKA